PLHPARGRVREPMTSSRKSPAPRPAGRSGRAWHRCVWIFAVLGVGLVVAWLILRGVRSEEHTSELQSRFDLVCRLLLETTKSSASNLLGLVKSGHPRDIDNLPAVARVGWAAVRT